MKSKNYAYLFVLFCLCFGCFSSQAQLKLQWASDNSALLSPEMISGVIDDPTDPALTVGVNFSVTGKDVSKLKISAKSSKQSVVKDNDLVFSGENAIRNLKIKPSGVGYGKITVSLTDGSSTVKYTLSYAASASASFPELTTFHTGMADASAAEVFEEDYFFVADDESNEIRFYHKDRSGLPVASFDLGSKCNVDAKEPEMDLEASTRGILFPNRIYWCGSLGNSKKGNIRSSRNRLVVTETVGSGETTSLKYVKHYDKLRENIIQWGDAKGYKLSASAADGMIPKRIDGFNVEGMAMGPDNSTCYIGFRAPLLPEPGKSLTNSNRKLALIVPVRDFESALNNGSLSGSNISDPILLDLNGRSIRSMERLKNGLYLIVAGMYDNGDKPALYLWSGYPENKPELLNIGLISFEEIHPEAFIEGKSSGDVTCIELISDNGTADYYGDKKEAKTLDVPYRKFRKDIIRIEHLPSGLSNVSDEQTAVYYVNESKSLFIFGDADSAEITDISGRSVLFKRTDGERMLNLQNLPKGIYIVRLTGKFGQITRKFTLK